MVLGAAIGSGHSDAWIIEAVGLMLIGTGFFFGAILFVAAGKLDRKGSG